MTNTVNYQQDLWPDDIQSVTFVSPKIIVEEQGRILSKKTSNILVGEVKKDDYRSNRSLNFFYDFFLYCSPLNYRYKLFSFSFGIENYPVVIDPDKAIYEECFTLEYSKNTDITAKSEEDFIEILRKIFSAQKTRKVIGGILAQV